MTAGKTWRAFIGQWGEWSHIDAQHEDRDTARRSLVDALLRFRDDTCETCRTTAAVALERLVASETDQEWWDEVDGEDYLLIHADRDQILDLQEMH